MITDQYDSIWQWALHGGLALGLWAGFVFGLAIGVSFISMMGRP